MACGLASCVMIFLSGACSAAESNATEVYDQFPSSLRDPLKKAYAAEIKRGEKIVSSARSAIATAKGSAGKESAKAEHERLKKALDDLKKKNDPPFVGTLIDICNHARRTEARDTSLAVVDVFKWSVGDVGLVDEYLEVASVTGPDSAVMVRNLSRTVLVRVALVGVSTDGWTDGSRRTLSGPFWVSGTRSAGGQTMLTVEPFDWKRYREAMKKKD